MQEGLPEGKPGSNPSRYALSALALLGAGGALWATFFAPWVQPWRRLDAGMFTLGLLLPSALLWWSAWNAVEMTRGRAILRVSVLSLIALGALLWTYQEVEQAWNLKSERSEQRVVEEFKANAAAHFKAAAAMTVQQRRKDAAFLRERFPETKLDWLSSKELRDSEILDFEPAAKPAASSWQVWEPVKGLTVARLSASWFLTRSSSGGRWVGAADSLNRFEWGFEVREDYFWDVSEWKLIHAEVDHAPLDS